MPQMISEIFSYSFVFLLGVILGALGEMFFGGHRTKQSSASESSLRQQVSDYPPVDDLPLSMDVPSIPQPDRTDRVEPTQPPPAVVSLNAIPERNQMVSPAINIKTPEKTGQRGRQETHQTTFNCRTN